MIWHLNSFFKEKGKFQDITQNVYKQNIFWANGQALCT